MYKLNNTVKNQSALKKMSVGTFFILILLVCSALNAIQYTTVGMCFHNAFDNNQHVNDNKTNKYGCLIFNLLNISLCAACILKMFNVI